MIATALGRRVLFCAAALAAAGAASAQEFTFRIEAPRFVPASRAAPAALSPSAAAAIMVMPAPALALWAAPSIAAESAPAAALPAAAAPAASALFAGRTETPDAHPREASASFESDRVRAGELWDGSGAGRGELGAVRTLAAPYRTKTQLGRLEAAPRAAGSPLRFAVIGDAEPGRFWFSRVLFNPDRGVFWNLLSRADRSGADFIVQLGDMVSRGVLRNFRAFFERLRAAAPRTPYLTVIGNHDRHRPHGVTNADVYRSLFGRTDYAFERGGRRFVVLDNSAGRVTPEQFEWLRGVLPKDRSAIVFTHMPPAPLGEWTDFPGRKGAGGFREGADEFMRLMSERKVARVYVGHVHGFGVLERGGVRYVLTGGGGSPLFPGPVKDRFHHFLTVDDGPDGLVETAHLSDGSSFVLR